MSAPYVRTQRTTWTRNRDALIAMAPALLAGWYFHGLHAILLTACVFLGAAAGEAILSLLIRKKCSLGDLSFAVSALVLTLLTPPDTPLWLAALAGAAAAAIKLAFGGLGRNLVNPAALAALPLHVLFLRSLAYQTPLSPLAFLTLQAGSAVLGGSSLLLLALGWGFLLVRALGRPVLSLSWLGGAMVLSLALELLGLGLGGGAGAALLRPLLGGSLPLAALFCASDSVTTPVLKRSQLILGLFCGLVTALGRQLLALDLSLLLVILANLLSRPLDRLFLRRR